MLRRLTSAGVVIALLGLMVVTGALTVPGNAAELGGGRILFTYPAGQIVWTMCPDGTDVRDFVEGGAARWSPDGTKIAYLDYGGETHIRTFNGDSDEIVADHIVGSAHGWSPDGTKLAFSKPVGSASSGGYIVRVLDIEAGSTTDLFTPEQKQLSTIAALDWSPDGSQIAFLVNDGSIADVGVWKVSSSGAAPALLKQSLVIADALSWSPDGSTIAFGKAGDGSVNAAIWVMAPDGGGASELIPNVSYPAYSPDGTRIAYVSYETGHIFTADIDGTDSVDLGIEGSDVDWGVSSCSPSSNRPDAKIKLSGSFIGNNLYSPTAQSVSTKAPRGAKRTFTIEVENDGPTSDILTLEGTGNVNGFSTKYMKGTTNISDEVSEGDYETPALAPGESFTLKLVVKVKDGATIGVKKSWTLNATSSESPTLFDAVKAKLKVIAS